MDRKETFLRTYAAAAVAAGRHFKLNPVVILAQAAHESAWGTSYGATARRNFFGIIAAGTKNEFWGGAKSQSSVSGLWFRIYETAEKGFDDFASLIARKYPVPFSVSYHPRQYAAAIAASPYISESNGDNRPAYARAVATNAATLTALAQKLGLSLT
jgi:flagellar protein FlgJ